MDSKKEELEKLTKEMEEKMEKEISKAKEGGISNAITQMKSIDNKSLTGVSERQNEIKKLKNEEIAKTQAEALNGQFGKIIEDYKKLKTEEEKRIFQTRFFQERFYKH